MERLREERCKWWHTRSYIKKEDTISPNILTEAILFTAAIEVNQQLDMLTVDIPNAFVQTALNQRYKGEKWD
jgi:hypothetical protein